jgi:tRNA dimethylallyltransferase
MTKILVIVGPTASGKSALAVRLAKRLKGEVISADSRQVYKGLNIGTGKVTKKEMQGIKHYLLDVVSPKKVFTANDFVKLANKAYSSILQNTRIPIIVGGTGFYIDALLGRVSLPGIEPDKTFRARLEKKSATELFKLLEKKNAERAQAMNDSDRQNPVRLIRALEIAAKGKKELKGKMGEKREKMDAVWVGIMPEKDVLRNKIHDRLLARMKMGMVKEAQKLHATGLSWKRMEDLGLEYRYLALHLQKKISKEEMVMLLEEKIWQYAKRQMTYWRRNKDIRWFATLDDAFAFVMSGR